MPPKRKAKGTTKQGALQADDVDESKDENSKSATNELEQLPAAKKRKQNDNDKVVIETTSVGLRPNEIISECGCHCIAELPVKPNSNRGRRGRGAKQNDSKANVGSRRKVVKDKSVLKTKAVKRPNNDNDNEDDSVSHPSHGTTSGRLLILGMGELGQLGLGEDIMEKKKPYPVGGALKDKNVVQVSCGGVHTVVLTDEGHIYSWGCNDEGALGRSIDSVDEYCPGLVDHLKDVRIVQVSAGDSHTVALSESGDVYCCGIFRDSDGPFGLIDDKPSMKPQVVYSDGSNKVIKVVSGAHHVAMLTEHGDIFTFGCAESGQLGRVPECFSIRGGRRGMGLLLTPQVVRMRMKSTGIFCDVYAGEHSTFAISKDAKVLYVWGLNNRGQLGTGDELSRYVPEVLPSDWLWDWTKKDYTMSLSIAGGSAHSIVTDNGSLYSMGANEYGQLGLPKEVKDTNKPMQVKIPAGLCMVACGTRCSFAITNEGRVYSWGIGSNYQLGSSEDDEDVFEPSPMQGNHLKDCTVLDVSSGGQHTALLVTSSSTNNDNNNN